MKSTFLLAAGLAIVAQSAGAGGIVPTETVGRSGGLNFGSALVAENFAGLSPRHTQEASLRPGRVVAETNPAYIRSGQTSIRMQIQPGDCSARIGGGQPDDCASGNERIEINTGTSSGTMLYAFSLLLGSDFRQLNEAAPTVSLVQWFQAGAGACFSIRYDADSDDLLLRNRCTNGSYNTAEPEDVDLGGDATRGFQEFVVLANWSKGSDGLFRLLVDNELVYDFRGPTLVAEGSNEVSQRFSVLRLDGLGQHTTTSTLWLDDVVASPGLTEIEQRYSFDRGNLGVQ